MSGSFIHLASARVVNETYDAETEKKTTSRDVWSKRSIGRLAVLKFKLVSVIKIQQ